MEQILLRYSCKWYVLSRLDSPDSSNLKTNSSFGSYEKNKKLTCYSTKLLLMQGEMNCIIQFESPRRLNFRETWTQIIKFILTNISFKLFNVLRLGMFQDSLYKWHLLIACMKPLFTQTTRFALNQDAADKFLKSNLFIKGFIVKVKAMDLRPTMHPFLWQEAVCIANCVSIREPMWGIIQFGKLLSQSSLSIWSLCFTLFLVFCRWHHFISSLL